VQFNPPQFVVIDERKIAYEEVVPSEPQGAILLLTGLASKRQGWSRQMPVFGARYRTIAIDHRDAGDSDLVTERYSTADQAEDVAAAMRALSIPRAHIIGISMGGFIALQLAVNHPEMVEKLVLTSTSAGGKTHVPAKPLVALRLMVPRIGREDVGKAAKRVYAAIMAPGYCKSHPQEWEEIAQIARYRPQSRAAYRRQLYACLHHDVAGRIGEIRAPTLVIHGDIDPLVPVANGRYLAQHIPGAQLIIYPQTGHIPIVEREAEYNRDVLAFLAG
jgi:pimeloyl-ACP methyl ester carboxylesterase